MNGDLRDEQGFQAEKERRPGMSGSPADGDGDCAAGAVAHPPWRLGLLASAHLQHGLEECSEAGPAPDGKEGPVPWGRDPEPAAHLLCLCSCRSQAWWRSSGDRTGGSTGPLCRLLTVIPGSVEPPPALSTFTDVSPNVPVRQGTL